MARRFVTTRPTARADLPRCLCLFVYDAFLNGLTATPTVQTIGFFPGNLVPDNSHEQAVANGVNIVMVTKDATDVLGCLRRCRSLSLLR